MSESVTGAPEGLSPRVRGNQRQHVRLIHVGDGSIPACAGEPLKGFTFPFIERVYPRVCGGTLNTAT